MAHDVTGKKPETCYKKELFYGSLCNVPIRWAWGGEKKKLEDFSTPHLSLWALGKGRARGRKKIKWEERKKQKGKGSGELIPPPLCCLCTLAQVLTTWGRALCDLPTIFKISAPASVINVTSKPKAISSYNRCSTNVKKKKRRLRERQEISRVILLSSQTRGKL